MATLTLLCLLLFSTCLMEAAAFPPECGGKPAFWGAANYKLVAKSGGDFNTVQAAINSISPQNNRWFKIHIKSGTYVEQVTILPEKPCIFLEGEGRGTTIIEYGAYAATDSSSTFCSYPPNMVVKGITFKNTHNLGIPLPEIYDSNVVGPVVPAVAARIYGDRSSFYDCGFVGVQDTLWAAKGFQYYHNCYIEGAVDFIFGSAQAFFENTQIFVTGGGFITAQYRSSSPKAYISGFVFQGGRVDGANPGIQTFLGRAYGPFSTVIFQSTFLSSIINPLGWDSWRFPRQASQTLYAEIGCTGPGSNMSKRVKWEKKIDPRKAARLYSKRSFIDKIGWIERQPTA
ncbi:Probable pectinesterase 55 [Linum perenne]